LDDAGTAVVACAAATLDPAQAARTPLRSIATLDCAVVCIVTTVKCRATDEVFLTINGKRHYLWRAVDQDDNVLDILVQSRRNKQAAKQFLRKLLKGLTYVPRVIITDKLKSYGAAKRERLPGVEHRQSRYLNNRCENSHRPTRQRERRMQGFKSPAMRNAFSPRTVLLPSTSDLGGICSQRPRTAKR
jgi:hypothetical protein